MSDRPELCDSCKYDECINCYDLYPELKCKYRGDGVICRKHRCKTCGWRPRYEEKQKERAKEALMPELCLDCQYYVYIKSTGKRAFKDWLRKKALSESVQKAGERDNPPSD